MKTTLKLGLVLSWLALGLSLPGGSSAQPAYPAKPIRLVSVHAPGGGGDTLSRLMASKLSMALGQPVVVENKPGGSTMIGAEFVAKAPADGYTLLMASVTTLSINPGMFAKMPYDPVRDFTPVSIVASMPFFVTVNPQVEAKNLKELIALAKAKPGTLNFGSPGSGSSAHLAGALLASMAGIDFVHVPYKGATAALTDVLAGRVQIFLDSISLPHVKAGKLRALAVTSRARSALMPDLPTVAEAGVPGYEATVWYGIVAPAGTPIDIVRRLNQEVNKALKQPDAIAAIGALAGDPAGNTPEEFARTIRADMATWAKVIKESGARMD
jgi:tripartite-type tricarboxylate transporter receptor subunit TctC